MSTEIKAPTFPESVADGSIATWHKKVGEAVTRDEPLVDIETDKVVLEVVAPADGVLKEIIKGEGDTVLSDEVVALFEEGASASVSAEPAEEATAPAAAADLKISPAARKMLDEKGIDAAAVTGTGKGGLITKEDVAAHKPAAAPAVDVPAGERVEKRVPMTRLRKRIAERLLEATHTTAMLTTFNEVNMKPIMDLRNQYKDLFEKSHNGTRLGFMGFFVKAACESLKRFPAVNASIDGDDVVYHGYQDVGVAVSTEKGLVVPVLRDAENMSMAKIEEKVRE